LRLTATEGARELRQLTRGNPTTQELVQGLGARGDPALLLLGPLLQRLYLDGNLPPDVLLHTSDLFLVPSRHLGDPSGVRVRELQRRLDALVLELLHDVLRQVHILQG